MQPIGNANTPGANAPASAEGQSQANKQQEQALAKSFGAFLNKMMETARENAENS